MSDTATPDTSTSAPASGVVGKWERELKRASEVEDRWRKSVDQCLRIYRDDGQSGQQPTGSSTLGGSKTWFNIFFSNTQTLMPALTPSLPRPDVRRRFSDPDPVAKQAGDILERALTFTSDSHDSEGVMSMVLQDYCIAGRGVPRVRYVPTMAPQRIPVVPTRDETGAPAFAHPLTGELLPQDDVQTDANGPYIDGEEQIANQELRREIVHWDDFRVSPSRDWQSVRWVAFRHRPTRDELVKDYGDKVGSAVPLTLNDSQQKTDQGESRDTFTRAEVWEVWDRTARKVLFICTDYKAGALKTDDDPLQLTGFFPIPRPIYSVPATDNLVPYPEYLAYEEQARELNTISKRIDKLTGALRLRGLYDAAQEQIAQLLRAEDNKMIPTENWQQLVQGGGIESAAMFLPVEMIAKVLAHLMEQRDACKQTIYEITGLADILRGASEASETATAQSIKSQWGSLRIEARRKEVERLERDLFRIEAELIAEHFEPQVLTAMTGLDVPDEVLALLRDDGPRSFRIDVETENATQLQEDRKEITDLLSGIVSFGAGIAPAVQSGIVPLEAAKSMLLAAVRRFRLGREVEDAINQIGQQAASGSVIPGAQGGVPMVGAGAPGPVPPAVAAPKPPGSVVPLRPGVMPTPAGAMQ